MGHITNNRRGLVHLLQRQIVSPRDIDQHASRTMNGDIIQQRTGYGMGRGVQSTGITTGFRGPHHGLSHFVHNRPNIGKVHINQTRHGDQIGNATHGLVQDIIRFAKGIQDGGVFTNDSQEFLVGNGDDRIHILA